MEDTRTAELESQVKEAQRSISQIAVLHIPHSSQRVPTEERQTILLDDAALNKELLRMTDAFAVSPRERHTFFAWTAQPAGRP
jgi:hypothetical protein